MELRVQFKRGDIGRKGEMERYRENLGDIEERGNMNEEEKGHERDQH